MSDTTNKEKARQLYESGYGSLQKVADSLGEKVNTIKSWKKRDSDSGDPWVKLGAKKKRIVATKTEKVATSEKVATKKKEKKEINYIDEISKEYKLTDKQTEFAIYYGNGNNIHSSCLKAKYSKSFALGMGYTLLENMGIKKIVEYIKKLRYENLMYNEKDILNQYIRIAQGDLGDYWDEQGENLKPFSEVDTGIIKEFSVKIGNDGSVEKKFKLESKHPALKAMGEYFGMFVNKNEGDNGSPLDKSKPSNVKNLLNKVKGVVK